MEACNGIYALWSSYWRCCFSFFNLGLEVSRVGFIHRQIWVLEANRFAFIDGAKQLLERRCFCWNLSVMWIGVFVAITWLGLVTYIVLVVSSTKCE